MSNVYAKPFLKWAGGKSQLLEQFEKYLPAELKNGEIEDYFEPFVGGGAVYFHIAQRYSIKTAYLFDINKELILAYRVVKKDVGALINVLTGFVKEYTELPQDKREEFYYNLRSEYNAQRSNMNYRKYSEDWIERAAQLIFLNKTCYNGLYRVNKSGDFNAPFGRYKNPSVFDEANLTRVSELLQNTVIRATDFTKIRPKVTEKSFVYFDPPYRPISKTAYFTSYSTFEFDDKQQKRLANLYKYLNDKCVKLMLSNSDPKNENPNDNFFEVLYSKYNIDRVSASRMINCNAGKRGQIHELIITNY